jgi:hypothetical protein
MREDCPWACSMAGSHHPCRRSIGSFKKVTRFLHGMGDLCQCSGNFPLIEPIQAAGSGFDGAKAEELMESGGADAIVVGKHFVSVPNLPDALRHKAKLPDNTYYGGGV